jgi:ribosome-interacting GTPase 1
MPANLPPAYHQAEAGFRAAVTRDEKIAALEQMLRLVPKHKGTEKLQADIKSRISKLRQKPKKKTQARGPSHRIPGEGAGQVVLVGPPNSGKSSLVAALTHAEPDVAEYPFTTRRATPGMMPHEDIAFQLIDLPPLSEEYVEPWVYDLIRGGDLVWLVLDAERCLEGLELAERLLGDKAIALVPAGTGEPAEPRPGWVYRGTLVVVTGMDRPGAREDLELLEELIEEPWPKVGVSSTNREGFEELGRKTFEALDIIRVYSKEPGKDPDLQRPFTLPRGSTVEELARQIHQVMAQNIRSARIWGPSAFDGQSVHANHVLEDGDVVEIHL